MELQDYERAHIQRLRDHLGECTVLLRSNGAFPLDAPCPVALYGSGARRTVKGGTGSGEVNSRYFDSVETGLEKAGFTVTTKAWLDGYDRIVEAAQAAFHKGLRARAKAQHISPMMLAMGEAMPEPEYDLPLDGAGETAIYVLARNSGEGADRSPVPGDILLTGTETRDIRALAAQFEKFLLVLNVGGVVDLRPVMDVPNILLLSQLGVETGDALADIVLGLQNPSGRLTTTWAAWPDYPALLDFGGADDTRYREGIYVGYRWFDTVASAPLFPFGYGLSFTTFSLAPADVTVEGSGVTVEVPVKNTGERGGKEVVQVYVSVPRGKLDQPYQMLAGWAKTDALAPGMQQTVSVRFDLRELASFDTEAAAYILEAGDYIVRVGVSSRDTVPAASLRLDRCVTVRRVKNTLGVPDFADFVPEPCNTQDAAPIIPVPAEAFAEETVDYQPQHPIDPAAAALADEQLALLSVGAFSKAGLRSMIGSAAKTVCGAAGETAHIAGFPNIVMADGPAGVRIHAKYYEDESGRHSMEPSLPAFMLEFLPKPLQHAIALLRRGPGDPSQLRYQYCTAIPIGTALAQSWNTDFARLCGDIVGAEMERFRVDLWLAPALNIHRSIRCGRNFEYFSEDPLLSGRFAAALTQGVQAHPGRGATVKHFAANNQEFCRTSNNSAVSQRALREIYLKGFEVCIRESAPKALMTSYNLINRKHTALRRDLIEDVLRCEFGFRGLVMTDWVVMGGMVPKGAKYPGPKACDVAAAGGDLFMPGSEKDFYSVLRALREGKLSREQLEINASRILHWLDA